MNTQSRPSILLVYPSCYYYPRALERDEVKSSQLLLASYLAQYFHVEYEDFEISIGRPISKTQIRRYERKVKDILEKRDFDILAISCWTSLSYRAAMTTARIARDLYPDRLIVTGGYHPTARPDDFQSSDNLFDYVIQGEGELALRDVAWEFLSAGRPSQTRVVTGPTLYPDDYVGVNWDLVDGMISSEFPEGLGTLCIYLSRGCPFECTFCMESLKEKSWRPCSPENGIEQIRTAASRYKVKAIAVGDACFGVQRKWRKEFLKRLVDLKPSYWVLFETRPEYLDREDVKLLSQLKAQIQFGLESCSPGMLRIMNKTKNPDKFLNGFRELSHLLSEHNVVHGANLIFNHPGETEQTLEETFAFMDAELTMSQSSLIWACHGYMHFPGSALDRNRSYYEKEFGSVFLDPSWWREDGDHFVSGRKVIPSRELRGEKTELWKKMLKDRDEELKKCLAPEAFSLAANTYFPDWQYDPRYEDI